jgi:uncharacterized protein YbaP (TraB family)
MTAIPKDTYLNLYRAKEQHIASVKKTYFLAGCITPVALLVLGALSGYALSHVPSIGTVGLIVCPDVGLCAAAVVALSVVIYIHELQVFPLHNLIQEDKGFLYAIKKDGKLKAYLFGTIHRMPQQWKGLNKNIQNKLNQCRKVIVEGVGTTPKKILTVAGVKLGPGVDDKIMDYVREKKIPLEGFEERKSTTPSSPASTENEEKISDEQLAQAYVKSAFELDRTIVTWQTGNAENAGVDILLAQTNGEGVKALSIEKRLAFKEDVHKRNGAWMPKIHDELAKEEASPVFIAVGSAHLFDFPELETTGLITLIQGASWTVEKIDS